MQGEKMQDGKLMKMREKTVGESAPVACAAYCEGLVRDVGKKRCWVLDCVVSVLLRGERGSRAIAFGARRYVNLTCPGPLPRINTANSNVMLIGRAERCCVNRHRPDSDLAGALTGHGRDPKFPDRPISAHRCIGSWGDPSLM